MQLEVKRRVSRHKLDQGMGYTHSLTLRCILNPKCVSQWFPMDPKGMKCNARHLEWSNQGSIMVEFTKIGIMHKKSLNSNHGTELGFVDIKAKYRQISWIKQWKMYNDR